MARKMCPKQTSPCKGLADDKLDEDASTSNKATLDKRNSQVINPKVANERSKEKLQKSLSSFWKALGDSSSAT